MKVICGIEFATSLEVLFKMKEIEGHKTMQETYEALESDNIDAMFKVLCISYNCAHKGQEISNDQFISMLSEKNIGLLKIAEGYRDFVESLMFGGMSESEIVERKNQLMNLQK